MSIELNIRFELTRYRCSSCGKFWAHESAYQGPRCAPCLRRDLDRMHEEHAKLQREKAALRGVITRMKAGAK